MGTSNHFADMNKVYVHTETTHKEQLAIRLWHMRGGPNSCRWQLRPRLKEAERKFSAEPWQYKKDQFQALVDQLETLPTKISNPRHHNEDGSRNPFTERRTKLTPISG
jgi:hypothetical protein